MTFCARKKNRILLNDKVVMAKIVKRGKEYVIIDVKTKDNVFNEVFSCFRTARDRFFNCSLFKTMCFRKMYKDSFLKGKCRTTQVCIDQWHLNKFFDRLPLELQDKLLLR